MLVRAAAPSKSTSKPIFILSQIVVDYPFPLLVVLRLLDFGCVSWVLGDVELFFTDLLVLVDAFGVEVRVPVGCFVP